MVTRTVVTSLNGNSLLASELKRVRRTRSPAPSSNGHVKPETSTAINARDVNQVDDDVKRVIRPALSPPVPEKPPTAAARRKLPPTPGKPPPRPATPWIDGNVTDIETFLEPVAPDVPDEVMSHKTVNGSQTLSVSHVHVKATRGSKDRLLKKTFSKRDGDLSIEELDTEMNEEDQMRYVPSHPNRPRSEPAIKRNRTFVVHNAFDHVNRPRSERLRTITAVDAW